MTICMIMDNPETSHHPVIAKALQQLGTTHTVRMLDVRTLTGSEAIMQESRQPLADLYLLKSHAPQALDVAQDVEQRGALVVNSWAASAACQDRLRMTEYMVKAGLLWPQTQSFDTLHEMLSQSESLIQIPYPFIMKSRYSHRGDLVEKIENRKQIEALVETWGQEPVIVQELVASDGWDIKVWVIDEHIYAARRRTPLDATASKEDFPITTDGLSEQFLHIIVEIGRVFHLRLYGVDLLMTEHGPIVVDINAFPGFRGVPDAENALVTLVERALKERSTLRPLENFER